MATFHDRTIAPKFQGRLLRGAGPCRVLTSDEVVAEIEAEFAGLIAQPWPGMPPEPLLSTAQARTLHSRRALERAADHGVALLAALGLPQPMRHDIKTHDPAAIGDALDVVIAHLDALDAPDEDLEEGGDTEDDGTAEPILGAPEEHPFVPMFSHFYRCRDGRQLLWGQGCNDAQNDGESEPGYDLPCDDDELDDDGLSKGEGDFADDEPWLASPAGDGDQRHWAQGGSRDTEDVNENGGGEYDPAWYERPIGPVRPHLLDWQPDLKMRDLARQAQAIRRRGTPEEPHPRSDILIEIAPGMMFWGGPLS